MAFATWWRGDQLPALRTLEGFSAGPTDDATLLARLAHLEVAEVEKRLSEGHRPYVGWLEGAPVAYGWVATQKAHVGELDLTITLPQGDRYLWDFATLLDWRGRGIYPHLLQAILSAESGMRDVAPAERFWIIAAPENRASSAGIVKAGFTSVAYLSFQQQGKPGLVAIVEGGRVAAAAALLQVAVLDDEAHVALSPCWHCAIDARENGREVADSVCWPEMSPDDLVVVSCQCG